LGVKGRRGAGANATEDSVKLIFVYDAGSGLLNLPSDVARKGPES